MNNDDDFAKDKKCTELNRAKLFDNKNLLYWYEKLYECQFNDVADIESRNILEVGSGTSPLKKFYKNIITSDILDLEYLDYQMDCHRIDEVRYIANESLDIITLTNVLHHLKDPLSFLAKASASLSREVGLSWLNRTSLFCQDGSINTFITNHRCLTWTSRYCTR